MRKAVDYACPPAGDQKCASEPDGDTMAYIQGGKPPIHFCREFRTDLDELSRQRTAIHEYTHLVGSSDDGGYADPAPQAMMCTAGRKFKAKSKILDNTADAITGFVMHIGLTSETEA